MRTVTVKVRVEFEVNVKMPESSEVTAENALSYPAISDPVDAICEFANDSGVETGLMDVTSVKGGKPARS